MRRDTVTDFVRKSEKVHGDRYDYSLVTAIKNDNTPVTIICRKHGPFEQKPYAHKHGNGCYACGHEYPGCSQKLDQTKSCACGNQGVMKNGLCINCHLRRAGEIGNAIWRKRPFESLYNALIKGTRGQIAEFSYEVFLKFTEIKSCHYCAASIMWDPYAKNNRYRYNLDRKDNGKLYTEDNCVVCCWDCNNLKGSQLTYEEMVLLSPGLKQIRKLREGSQSLCLRCGFQFCQCKTKVQTA